MESRHLGPITLDGVPGGGAMNVSVLFEGPGAHAQLPLSAAR